MSRPQVLVRRVDDESQQHLLQLWAASRSEAEQGAQAAPRTTVSSLPDLLSRPEVRVFLALVEESAVGYLVLTDSTSASCLGARCVSLEEIYVSPEWRRHGVARHLLAAAATHADRTGADQIVSNVPSHMRDANRFFARLGFTPVVVRRVTSPAALHRRLAGAGQPRYTLDQVLQRRRIARVRAVRQATTGMRTT